VLCGGSFGRRFETEIAAQAAILAQKLKRPVQLQWSRAEDMMQDRFRPAARVRLSARLGRAGRIEGWHARIAAPDAMGEVMARVMEGALPHEAREMAAKTAQERAAEGAIPPYGVGVFAIDHHPVDTGIPSGKWRSDAHSYTAFFNECFVDELARASGVEPFSFRMALLGGNPRLALCLSKAATKGSWEGGGQGTGQGLACHVMPDACIAVLAEAALGDDQRVRVTRLVAVADVGRVVNPDIARQQVEGGLLFGMAQAVGNAVTVEHGIAGPLRLGALGLPRLADMPEMSVELIVNNEPPGRVGEIGVPPVAPAIANALFAGSGRRFRSLPLAPTNG
jgi:isoquinoline 1-oxidoreductase beta subunit